MTAREKLILKKLRRGQLVVIPTDFMSQLVLAAWCAAEWEQENDDAPGAMAKRRRIHRRAERIWKLAKNRAKK